MNADPALQNRFGDEVAEYLDEKQLNQYDLDAATLKTLNRITELKESIRFVDLVNDIGHRDEDERKFSAEQISKHFPHLADIAQGFNGQLDGIDRALPNLVRLNILYFFKEFIEQVGQSRIRYRVNLKNHSEAIRFDCIDMGNELLNRRLSHIAAEDFDRVITAVKKELVDRIIECEEKCGKG